MLVEDLRLPKEQETLHNWVYQKGKKREREGMQLGQDQGSWEGVVKEERFPHTGKSPHWQRPARIEGELWTLRGDCSNLFVHGKLEKDLHSQLVPPASTH